jgi:hypothetical protein
MFHVEGDSNSHGLLIDAPGARFPPVDRDAEGQPEQILLQSSLEVFELRKVLPRGMIFLDDFGFVLQGASQAATHHPPDAS